MNLIGDNDIRDKFNLSAPVCRAEKEHEPTRTELFNI